MSGKAILKETIKKNTIRDMKILGNYKPEYEPIIDIYSDLMEQYEKANKRYKESGYQYSIATADGGGKKSPVVAVLENLRKDILQYSDRLCLNPKANQEEKKGSGKPKLSKLASALRDIEG